MTFWTNAKKWISLEWQWWFRHSAEVPFLKFSQAYERARFLVNIIYLYAYVRIYVQLSNPEFAQNLEGRIFPDIVSFLSSVPIGYLEWGVHLALWTLLPAVFWNRGYFWRALFAVTFLFTEAIFWSKTGAGSHANMTLLWVILIFCLLPRISGQEQVSRIKKRQYLFVFWAAIAAFLLSYVQSGFWKFFHGGFYALLTGQISLFNLEAMPRLIAWYSVQSDVTPVWADFLIRHAWLATPALWIVALLQLTAFVPLFFPRWMKLYGMALIVFHVASIYVLTIPFFNHIFLCGVFLIWGPFNMEHKGFWTERGKHV